MQVMFTAIKVTGWQAILKICGDKQLFYLPKKSHVKIFSGWKQKLNASKSLKPLAC